MTSASRVTAKPAPAATGNTARAPHPREERAEDPPHWQVPPGRAAAHRVPRPGVGLERPQEHDVPRGENDRAPQSHRRRTGDAFDTPRHAPETGKEGRRSPRRQNDQRLHHVPQTGRGEVLRDREVRHHRRSRSQPDFRTAGQDRAEVRAISRSGCHSGRHARKHSWWEDDGEMYSAALSGQTPAGPRGR